VVTNLRNICKRIADCEMMGAHWVLSLDKAFKPALERGDLAARKRWEQMCALLHFFENEANKKWRLPIGRSAACP